MLIVREIDRLSRSLAKQLIVEDELKRYNVAIEYVLGEYPDTPKGSLLKNVRASIAEFERLKIIERSTRGRRLRVETGSVLVFQHPPYGYRAIRDPRDNKYHLIIEGREADVVQMIFSWYTAGDNGKPMAIREIARRLTTLGIPTAQSPIRRRKRHTGWPHSTVRKLLY